MNSLPIPTPASLHLRLIAGIYDLFPLLPIWFFSAMACLLVTNGTLDYHAWWYRGILLLVTAMYFIVSWVHGGQTIGLKTWRLRVVRTDGLRLTAACASLRFLIALISLGVCGLGFFWALLEPQRRTWHDLATGTVMLRISK